MTRTVLIIGASRGLGLGLARQFSSEGWEVIATVRDPARAEALRALGGVRIEALDMDDAASLERLAERLAGTRLDVLYVNAGIAGPQGKPATAASQAEVGELFFTNAVAPVRLAERLLPLVDPAQGVVVFMSSILGSVETGPGMGMDLYGASKAALNHLTRTFVAGLGETRLTVLSMHPGWVKTDMGGDQAPLDVETSARGMVQQVTQAIGQGGHRYIDYQGERLAW
ncbi:SDR family oxidoreductase [Stutzerimonas balearica]|jgi:NAD(P)-dependent dehydrogenase (short-subunit alcohol dehydrogenase family)|uniref:Short-chain dehydrogenase n=3 Tax=Stutzerimonas balearica TaxID=74829 RepID=A0A8D4C230_9GAMM|nr:SDR family oxidoreductase [Stutzerimonas balearica]MBB60043.1 short-chain dehydrogenase [Pseudomonas sp.]MBZ5755436.1 SDR family oxidoreductase [Pseudomonas sp. S5(2021)]WIX03848.1 SDR family oxidoreductase [Pseudomonas sp. AR5]AJE14540.1 short-chain dehydrogenase [Stutzerimonas balearica DSM 6083]MBC7201043.1 SDR family oxidoreductase [Stutzerimonas balearica]